MPNMKTHEGGSKEVEICRVKGKILYLYNRDGCN